MFRRSVGGTIAVTAAAFLVPTLFGSGPTQANEWTVDTDHSWCEEGSWDRSYCEVREIVLPGRSGVLEVEAGKNGGIEVQGADIDEIRIWARVQVYEESRREAADLAHEITIETGDVIRPRGPRDGRWSVTFRIELPRDSDVELLARNGGISIRGVHGEVGFETINGGVSLRDLGGYVEGVTRNGGLDVELSGPTWDGKGLNVETTNGGVNLAIPEGYSAELVTGTTNGRLHVDFPVLVEGDIARRIRTELGDGGPLIRVMTRNGGVQIEEI